ncbi:MAG: B12-binding domain-containing radical SAM protein [Deltaproteobacteria bacterium]|nr:B12-binding domain-containing radical SAM protein [Deltaproteobacteria bacterium]
MQKGKEIKKIIFIEAKPPDFHVFSRIPLPRLGTILLGTILKQAGYEVSSYVEEFADIELDDLLTADAVGLSTLTSTTPRSYEIADQLKKHGITVFMGGPHVTYIPDEAIEHCDYVMRGEADETILDFIHALEKGEGFEAIPGLTYRQDGNVVHNKSVSICKDLDALPAPDYTILKGIGTDVYKLEIAPIMTSRGCPYDCSFCSVTSMFGHKFRYRAKEKVLDELRLHKEAGGKFVFFYDDNFTINRKRAKALLQSMIDEELTPRWTAQVSVDVAKDLELVKLMQKSKCYTVYIGLESINPETLKAYNKKQTVEDIENCISILHQHNINVHGMFVFGSDEDTVETIHATVDFAKRNNIETVQFLILTPLPGTRMYHELDQQGRIFSKDWSLYDAHHVVYKPKNMTYHELQVETMKATKRFYSVGQIIKRAVRLQVLTTSLKAYGRHMSKTWDRRNKYFVEYTKSITDAGKILDLKAKQTAEDIKDKFRQIELTGQAPQPKIR